MRINSSLIQPTAHQKAKSLQVRYAMLRCLSYTSKTEKLTEMLLYVLECSIPIANKLEVQDCMFDVIDQLVQVIGCDYKDANTDTVVKIFAQLDSITRQSLFVYMFAPLYITDKADILPAKHKLSELLKSVNNQRFDITNQADTYLRELGCYLQCRLSEIAIEIVKKICI